MNESNASLDELSFSRNLSKTSLGSTTTISTTGSNTSRGGGGAGAGGGGGGGGESLSSFDSGKPSLGGHLVEYKVRKWRAPASCNTTYLYAGNAK